MRCQSTNGCNAFTTQQPQGREQPIRCGERVRSSGGAEDDARESLQQEEALEAAVRKAVCRFESEFMAGSFAERIRVLVAPDMIVVRSKGVLLAAEQQLVHTEEGRALVKQLYQTLFAQQRHILMHEVQHSRAWR